MIEIEAHGSFDKTDKFLKAMSNREHMLALEGFGQRGIDALSSATPVDTRLTADSWRFKLVQGRGKYTLTWFNTNVANGIPVVVLIQYGHGTGTGGWVEGRDFINPAIQPIFDQIANDVWEKVRHA